MNARVLPNLDTGVFLYIFDRASSDPPSLSALQSLVLNLAPNSLIRTTALLVERAFMRMLLS